MASQARRGTGRGGPRGGHPPTAAQGAQGAENPPLYPDLSRNVDEAVRIHNSLNRSVDHTYLLHTRSLGDIFNSFQATIRGVYNVYSSVQPLPNLLPPASSTTMVPQAPLTAPPTAPPTAPLPTRAAPAIPTPRAAPMAAAPAPMAAGPAPMAAPVPPPMAAAPAPMAVPVPPPMAAPAPPPMAAPVPPPMPATAPAVVEDSFYIWNPPTSAGGAGTYTSLPPASHDFLVARHSQASTSQATTSVASTGKTTGKAKPSKKAPGAPASNAPASESSTRQRQSKGKARAVDQNPPTPRMSAHPYANARNPPTSTEEPPSWAAHSMAELPVRPAAPTMAGFPAAPTMAEPQPAPAAVPSMDTAQPELRPVFEQPSSAMDVGGGDFGAGPSSSTASAAVPFYQHQNYSPWEFQPNALSDAALAGPEYGMSTFFSAAEACGVAPNPHIQDDFGAMENYRYEQQLGILESFSQDSELGLELPMELEDEESDHHEQGAPQLRVHRGALNNHHNTCKPTKRRFQEDLADLIHATAETSQNAKRQRREAMDLLKARIKSSKSGAVSEPTVVIRNDHVDVQEPGVSPSLPLEPMPPSTLPDEASAHPPEPEPADEEDLSLSLAARRKRRQIQLPTRLKDFVPNTLPDQIAPPPTTPPSNSAPGTSVSHSTPATLQFIDSAKNVFGLFHRFSGTEMPTHDPETRIGILDLTDTTPVPGHSVDQTQFPSANHPGLIPVTDMPTPTGSEFHPFDNESSYRLAMWRYAANSSNSQQKFYELTKIVGGSTFNPEDICRTNWQKMHKVLGHNDFDANDSWPGNSQPDDLLEWNDVDAGWRRKPITLDVPFHRQTPNPGNHQFAAGYIYHRSLVEIIREKLQNPVDSAQFHYEPYELRWQPPSGEAPSTRVHGEFYASPTFLDAHRELQAAPNEPGCSLQKVIVAMEFSSDATQLTHFGTAKLWPLYLYFLNESKYRRCKPTANLCNHVAYFESLPDSFSDFVAQHNKGRGLSKRHLTHCRRELFHAQWDILLDDEFMEAYVHGIVVLCCDGILRRFYPRIFVYAADYPEKQLGTPEDIERRAQSARVDDDAYRRTVKAARDLIYKHRHTVDSKEVEALLKAQSLTPTANMFSKKLGPLGFSISKALLNDFMHEVEIGVWKGLFVHLLRILEAHDKKTKMTIKEFNKRFRLIPTFGRDTIRRFVNDVSELKQLAARDYEDLLQCCIPVFDGLLPEPFNASILSLLFTCAHWHGLAKLRMHTDHSIALLERETERLYAQLHNFADHVCPAFDTFELRRELEARQRAKQRRDAKAAGTAPNVNANKGKGKAVLTANNDKGNVVASIDAIALPLGPQRRQYTLKTVKHHFLADYPNTIRAFGTTDSYSTEPPELEHRNPKNVYIRGSHKHVKQQLAATERRRSHIRRIRRRLYGNEGQQDNDDWVAIDANVHHYIGKTENDSINISKLLSQNKGDPAIKDFLPKLKEHILPRVLSELRGQGGVNVHELPRPSDCDADTVILPKYNNLYEHRITRINYTTYDVRRDQDLINPYSSHCIIMVACPSADPSNTDNPPYRYGHVIGTYHLNVVYNGPGRPDYHDPHRIEVLWRLSRLRLTPIEDDDAFGFIDPASVLRGCHIMPRFQSGRVHESGIGQSKFARDALDWKEYYINRFIDRDMLMRYHLGLGIGHIYGHRYYTAYEPSLPCNTTSTPSNLPANGLSSRDDIIEEKSDTGSDDPDDEGRSDFSDEDDEDDQDGEVSDSNEEELYAEDMYAL
ncbi:hypothetical protein HWV62_43046 [Athelia sp. TMB]|nr:hypothetical protein HWV62_43046 [Athelia sp. TMB]